MKFKLYYGDKLYPCGGMQLGFLPTSRKDKEGLRRLQQEDER